MLQFIKKLFFKERRSHPRYLVNGSFVLVVLGKEGTVTKCKVNVIDISLGGTAFIYEGSPDELAKLGLIRLSSDMPEALEFKTISDVECSEGSTYRKRRVKFEWKGLIGKKQLIEFIKKHGLLLEQ